MKLLSAALLIGALCCQLAAETKLLNQPDKWRAMGSGKVTVAADAGNHAIAITAERANDGKDVTAWPLFTLPEGVTFKEVAAIRFELNLSPDGTPDYRQGQIVLPKYQEVSGNFAFSLPAPGKWETIEVKFDRPGYDMAAVRRLQILIRCEKAAGFSFAVRNITLIDQSGNEIQTLGPADKTAAVERRSLQPAGAPAAFVASPGMPQKYRFAAGDLADGTRCDWQLTGLTGEACGNSGTATVANRALELELTLPQGFYELTFLTQKQTFGVAVPAAPAGTADRFFAMEALLEDRPAAVFQNILPMLSDRGIVRNREWSNLATLAVKEGVIDEKSKAFYDESAKHNIKNIFAFHDFPEWMDGIDTGKRRTLPGNLPAMNDVLARLLDLRKASLEGVQILNEYDQTPVPAEACLAPLKAAEYVVRDRDLNIVGAGFSRGATVTLRDSISGNMLDFIDVFAIHSYGTPEDLVGLIASYRQAMQGHVKGNLPIWVTESGKAWARGSKNALGWGGELNRLRPDAAEDMTSALWIVMKAVEAKAAGAERYYPFTLLFFQENDNNFGMLDYYGTPLRSFTSYAAAAGLLAGADYRGDWREIPANLHSIRVFAGEQNAVAVLYAGKDGIGKRQVDITKFPDGKAYGIDGAVLTPQAGTLTFDGGLAYWVFPAAKLTADRLNTDTEAMRLLTLARSYQPVKRHVIPVVYRYDFRRAKEDWHNHFTYRLPADGKLYFMVSNLSDTVQRTTPAIRLPDGVKLTQPLPAQLELPPHSETALEVALANSGPADFVLWLGDAADPLAAARVPLLDLGQLRPEATDYTDLGRWRQNSSGKQTFSVNPAEQSLKISADFREKTKPESNNWSFPEFELRQEADKPRLVAISFDLRCELKKPDSPVLFPLVMLADKGSDHYDSFPVKDPQSQWKHYLIPVSLREKPYDVLRIGMGTIEDQFSFEIRNVQLWR